MRSEAGLLTPGSLTVPGTARRTRAALPAAVREKLERLETEAETARVRARTLNDRVLAARDEEQRLTRRLEELRLMHPVSRPGAWVPDRQLGPTGRRWQPAIDDNPDDLEHTLTQQTAELERLTRERDVAQQRWNALGQLVARCRTYLGL
jgi:predicted  nucleic acid-binding Zn-ribbon protein